MATQAGLGVPEIDYQAHCVQLATAVEALLKQPDGSEFRFLAQMMLDEYREALARRDTPAPVASNVVPLHAAPLVEAPPLLGVAVQGDRGLELKPFSLHHAVDALVASQRRENGVIPPALVPVGHEDYPEERE